MLSRFFALYTDIYLFNRLIIILQPTGERLEWEEKHSRRIPADPATGGRPAADQFLPLLPASENGVPANR